MTTVRVGLVDVYLLRPSASGPQVLLLRRAVGGRSPGSWEAIHGHIEVGESPADAALREVQEEAGLVPDRLYSLSRVERFYLHVLDEVALVPVFAGWVPAGAVVRFGIEHDAFDWLEPPEAIRRCSWPRSARAIADAMALVGSGTAGLLEDVLRVR